MREVNGWSFSGMWWSDWQRIEISSPEASGKLFSTHINIGISHIEIRGLGV
jgi:hypothetical protein